MVRRVEAPTLIFLVAAGFLVAVFLVAGFLAAVFLVMFDLLLEGMIMFWLDKLESSQIFLEERKVSSSD